MRPIFEIAFKNLITIYTINTEQLNNKLITDLWWTNDVIARLFLNHLRPLCTAILRYLLVDLHINAGISSISCDIDRLARLIYCWESDIRRTAVLFYTPSGTIQFM